MDRLIYTAASGAKHILEQQATTSNNLANVSTTGFRAQIDMFRAAPVQGPGMPTRAFVVDSTAGNDFAAGPLQATGRDLDVAVKGQGWLALQMPDGTEAYTRNGSLQMSPNGVLQTPGGQTIAGEGGPITVPPDATVATRSRQFAFDFNFDTDFARLSATDATYTESAMSFMVPPGMTQLDALRDRGAKVLVVQGVADGVFSSDDTRNWYEALTQAYRGDARPAGRRLGGEEGDQWRIERDGREGADHHADWRAVGLHRRHDAHAGRIMTKYATESRAVETGFHAHNHLPL